MARIFIVDDHPVIRESVAWLIESEEGMELCGEAATAEEAVRKLSRGEPDLVLIDISLPETDGIELAALLRKEHPDLPLLMLSGHGEKGYVHQALEVGASGYVLKGNARELPDAIRACLRGERYISAALDCTPEHPTSDPGLEGI